MKRSLWVVMMLFVVFAPSAYADIPTFGVTQAILSLSANFGGDNETFSFHGPGINIFGGGTALCGWCGGDVPLAPGSSLTPGIDLVTFDNTNGTAIVGGHSVDLTGGYLFSSSITALDSFTFPTDGRSSFTVSIPAGYSDPFIQGSAPSLLNYNLQILGYGVGTMSLTFTSFPSGNGTPASYEFSRGQFSLLPTPDPGMFGLMVTGLSGIVVAKFRKALSCRRRAT